MIFAKLRARLQFGCDDGKDLCANGHAFPEWTAPTCEVAGNSERSCTRSGCTATDTRTEGFAALTHDWLYDPGAKLPTCTETGLGHRHCQRAGCNADEPGTTPYPIDPNNHDWNSTLETISEGVEVITCKRVGCNGKKDYVFQYAIGDTGPADGIIIYVADNTDGRPDGITIQGYTGATGSFAEYTAYYLEAAPANASASTMRWSNTNVLIPNLSQNSTDTTDRAIGRGRLNTAIIIEAHSTDTVDNNATKAAAAYTNGEKDDWFLPSREELNQMYIQRSHVGITTAFFWSSSQYNNNSAWLQNFDNGLQDYYNKSNIRYVRAIRAF